MNGVIKYWLGGLFAAIGIVAWAYGLAFLDPAAHDALLARDAFAEATGKWVSDADGMEQLRLLGRDLRWTALAMAVGALVLMTRHRRGSFGVPILLAGVWLTADLIADALGLTGPLTAVLATVLAAAGVLGALTWISRTYPQVGPVRHVIVYMGLVGSLGVALFHLDVEARPYLSDSMIGWICVVGIGAITASLALALAQVPRLTLARGISGLLVAGAVSSGVVAWWWSGVDFVDVVPFLYAGTWLGIPVLLVAFTLLTRPRIGPVAAAAHLVLLAPVSAATFLAILVPGLILGSLVVPDPAVFYDGFEITVAAVPAGLLGGLAMALVASIGGQTRHAAQPGQLTENALLATESTR